MCSRNPIQCIIPPYINDQLAQSADPATRSRAIANLKAAAAMRAVRVMAQAMPAMMVNASPAATKHRLVYDAAGSDQLRGTLVRSEGQAKSSDVAVNEAYDASGDTYDFYQTLFQRNSLDDNGMSLVSSVHVGETDETGQLGPMNNAFWNGEQMAYGDGDGVIFKRFTGSLDVVGHELTHGVQSFTSNLTYFAQSGALNEHFADVFGILVRQWKRDETALQASWVVGAEIMVPAATRRGIRDMENPGTAYANDPDLGTDPQPAHMSKIYTGPRDRQGVHINSGIPNRVFALVAKEIKGRAWEVAGRLWYDTLLQLSASSQFLDCAKLSVQIAGAKYGAAAKKAVKSAWKKVGITV
ncbi:M4 family metallopeptidase [Limnoglobus roseus]|uniref:Neutral metalloproteinase n=1 Tax=Limnoglobus roseus TaxID=2598579 RepID=A0A5C1AD39_9BACT|nr:M4 family metallopeptidase [Limnoglobus roseus]QEL15682.1 M4 family peptidase [Limnoglobus roseus]